jgi:hypothetical protein
MATNRHRTEPQEIEIVQDNCVPTLTAEEAIERLRDLPSHTRLYISRRVKRSGWFTEIELKPIRIAFEGSHVAIYEESK